MSSHGHNGQACPVRTARIALGATLTMATLLLAGCGPARDDCTCIARGATATIADNHGHALTIPASDFEAFADRNYQIKGTASHDHVVNYTSQQFQVLSNGGTAKSTSTVEQGHSHDVTIACGCN